MDELFGNVDILDGHFSKRIAHYRNRHLDKFLTFLKDLRRLYSQLIYKKQAVLKFVFKNATN